MKDFRHVCSPEETVLPYCVFRQYPSFLRPCEARFGHGGRNWLRKGDLYDSPFALQSSQKRNVRRVLDDLGRLSCQPLQFRCSALSQATQSWERRAS